MAAQATWLQDKSYEITFDGGRLSVDRDGPHSTDLVLAGLLACSGRTFQDILAKMHLEVEAVSLMAEADREKEPPKIFTQIRVRWTVRAGDTPVEKVRRALDLTEQYCTVLNILKRSCPVEVVVDLAP